MLLGVSPEFLSVLYFFSMKKIACPSISITVNNGVNGYIVAHVKTKLMQLVSCGLFPVVFVVAGCVTTDHKPADPVRTLSIGSVQSAVDNEKKLISLVAGVSAAGYLKCFYQDQTETSIRLYPSEGGGDSYVSKGAIVNLSEQASFKSARTPNGSEKVACFLTKSNLDSRLPEAFKQPGFMSYGISKIKLLFAEIAGDDYQYAEAVL